MTKSSEKYVYFFGDGSADGRAEEKNLLGGKGANLAEMSRLGIPVPAGFTITTEVCTYYTKNNLTYPEGLQEQVEEALQKVEKVMDARFGDTENPLLVSVRSGARASMPGMMDTVLNLGLNDNTIQGMIKKTDNPRFVYDSYRRFVAMYGDVVLGVKAEKRGEDPFEELLEKKKKARGVKLDTELSADDLKELAGEFKAMIKERLGIEFPETPRDQLWGAIGAVFGSWDNDRAIAYRALNNIPSDWGTAVNVQAMVYGNMGEDSGTGVAFTRDPALGENVFYGEFLMNAQGEDVVAGTRTPQPLTLAQKKRTGTDLEALEEKNPPIYKQLSEIRNTLEQRYKDMQDVEFTIQEGRLWMLQTRTGKRTGLAAVRMAVEMVEEGLIDEKTGLMRLEPEQHLNQLLQPIFDPREKKAALDGGRLLAKGLAAGPGAATGRLVFHAEDAEAWAKKGEKVILTRIETSPEDIRGMAVAQGILTARGGSTSHAALVARQMGKVCVAGCGELEISYKKSQMSVAGNTFKEGDWISLDGFQGEVLEGKIDTHPSEVFQVLLEKTIDEKDAPIYKLYKEVMSWADKYRKLEVWTNADQPKQAANAVAFGAQGIGLCRTEHMFFEGDRIDKVREMILAEDEEGRRKALEKLQPLQEEDFYGIFKEMDGRPVTVRLLDPPLHEFLPHEDKQIEDLAGKLGVKADLLKNKVQSLSESNPMLGHRGCRLSMTYPEIAEMQFAAIIRAACKVKKEGTNVRPEIMIPIVSIADELKYLRQVGTRVADAIIQEEGADVIYTIGTMIELPRACIVADQIGAFADFFSFGTNDLTQTTFGFSRDDSGPFISHYLETGVMERDPFQAIDQDGVGALMRLGVEKGRQANPQLKVGICGEHGGEPSSVEFCHFLNLNYVSCSPFRVPIAMMAAAQAALRDE